MLIQSKLTQRISLSWYSGLAEVAGETTCNTLRQRSAHQHNNYLPSNSHKYRGEDRNAEEVNLDTRKCIKWTLIENLLQSYNSRMVYLFPDYACP